MISFELENYFEICIVKNGFGWGRIRVINLIRKLFMKLSWGRMRVGNKSVVEDMIIEG